MADSQLYDETFTITSLSAEKYDRVSRLAARSGNNDTTMTLDINHELFPCVPGESIQVVLATTLALDGSKDEERGWRDMSRTGESTLADMYDYVCRGKLYKFEEEGGKDRLKVFISFGGLLMYLDGPYRKMAALKVDYMYLLVKK